MSRWRTFLEPVTIWRYISIWEVFILPLVIVTGWVFLVQDPYLRVVNQDGERLKVTAPFWSHFVDVMPLDAWGVGLWLVALALMFAFAIGHALTVRIAYALLTAFWFFIAFVFWTEISSPFLLTLSLSLAQACILRQAVLSYQVKRLSG